MGTKIPIGASIIEPVGGHGGMAPYDFNLCKGLSSNGVNIALFTSEQTSPPIDPTFSFRPIYKGIFGKAAAWKRAMLFLWASFRVLITSVKERRTICHYHFFLVGPLQFINVLIETQS